CMWFDVGKNVELFFFQAEDGIRDWSVTGVQTCALPISALADPKLNARLAWKCGGAPLGKPRVQLGIGKGRVDLRVELVDDLGWRSEERRVGEELRCGWGA